MQKNLTLSTQSHRRQGKKYKIGSWFLECFLENNVEGDMSSPTNQNRSVDEAFNLALHFILKHLDYPGTYARTLFVNFSSALDIIIPATLKMKSPS